MHAYLDLKGVVINHNTGRALPLMDVFLRGLRHNGWNITILTSYRHQDAEVLMREAGLPANLQILSSAGREKGDILVDEVRKFRSGQFVFLDDKPDNLASVRKRCGDTVRAVGFVGSRKYCPRLSEWCSRNGVELALSMPDLFEGLQVGCDPPGGLVHATQRLSEADLALMIPGLDHPMSALAGETCYFDHRAVLAKLLGRHPIADFPNLWANLPWITCGECLIKAFVQTVIKALGLKQVDVLKAAYKYFEYLLALGEFSARHPDIDFKNAFSEAFKCAYAGISQIGIDAQDCRLSGRPIEPDRLEFARAKITGCLEHNS